MIFGNSPRYQEQEWCESASHHVSITPHNESVISDALGVSVSQRYLETVPLSAETRRSTRWTNYISFDTPEAISLWTERIEVFNRLYQEKLGLDLCFSHTVLFGADGKLGILRVDIGTLAQYHKSCVEGLLTAWGFSCIWGRVGQTHIFSDIEKQSLQKSVSGNRVVDTALITQDTTQKVGKIGRFSAYILSTLGYKRNSNSVISTTPTVSYLDLLRIQESLLLLEVDAKEFQERNPQMNPQTELAYIAQKRVECTKLLSTYILETSLREGQLMSKDLFISQSHEKFSIDRPHLYPKTYSRSDSIMQMRNMLVWCISDRLADPADIKPAIRDQLMKNMGEMCMDFFGPLVTLHLIPDSGQITLSVDLEQRDALHEILLLLFPSKHVVGQCTPGKYMTREEDGSRRLYFQGNIEEICGQTWDALNDPKRILESVDVSDLSVDAYKQIAQILHATLDAGASLEELIPLMKNLSSRSPEVRETYQRYLIQDARTIRLFLSLLDRYPALKSFPLKPHDDVFSEAQGELVDIVFLATDRDVSRRRLMRLKPLCKDETIFESFQRELEDIYRRLSVAQGESATPTTLSQALGQLKQGIFADIEKLSGRFESMFPYSDIRENRHPEAQKNEDVLQLVQAYVKFIQTDILYLFSIPSTGIIHIDFLGSVIQRLAEYKNIFKTLQCTMVLRSVEDIEPLIQWYIHYSITLVHTSGSTPRIPGAPLEDSLNILIDSIDQASTRLAQSLSDETPQHAIDNLIPIQTIELSKGEIIHSALSHNGRYVGLLIHRPDTGYTCSVMSVSDSPKQIKEYPISPSVIPNESIKIVPYDSDAFSILRGTKFTNTLYNVTQERPGNSNILQNTHVQAFYSNSHGIFLLSPEGTVTWISYPSGENTAKEMILHEPHFPEIYTSLMGVTDFRVVPSTPHSKIFLKDITGWLLYTEIGYIPLAHQDQFSISNPERLLSYREGILLVTHGKNIYLAKTGSSNTPYDAGVNEMDSKGTTKETQNQEPPRKSNIHSGGEIRTGQGVSDRVSTQGT